jgi:hypothetical protein
MNKGWKTEILFLMGCAVIMGTLVLVSCASSGGNAAPQRPIEAAAPPRQAENIERVILDYKGADLGAQIPDWVYLANDDNYDTIIKLSRFKGKIPIINSGTGKNLDMLRSWVNNFNVQAEVSRRISNMVDAKFSGGQLGSKDTPENISFIKEIVATFSQTEINGLAKEMDFWSKLRIIDHGKETEEEHYTYYVVYSISEDDLNYQIAQAMGKIAAKNQEQADLKTEVEDAMKQVAFRGIQAAE